jgi:mannosyltransferase OCH1-like enzyme
VPHFNSVPEMTDKIPARIIQTGRNGELPLRAQATVANLKLLHPDFEYLFFDDAAVNNFVAKEFPQYREMFRSFPIPIQKFDFFRYLAIYKLGGFYFDLDVLLATGLDELLDESCVFPFEELSLNKYLRQNHGMDWEIGNYAFGAASGHPFLAAIIENCVRAQRDPAWVQPMMRGIPKPFRCEFYVLNTTGPGLISRTLAENPTLAKEVTVLFPDDVCDTRTWHQFGKFGVHAMEGSWRGGKSYLRRRLGNLWEAWTMKRLLNESRLLGAMRTTNFESAKLKAEKAIAEI